MDARQRHFSVSGLSALALAAGGPEVQIARSGDRVGVVAFVLATVAVVGVITARRRHAVRSARPESSSPGTDR